MRLITVILVLLSCTLQAAQPVGNEITIKTALGTQLQAYVAGPEDAPYGILLLHDRWGLNDTMRQWADRFAAKGYRALAIDVFDGRASNKMDRATEILASIDPEWVKVDVKAGLAYLKRDGRKLATLGAGFGGWQSFQAAVAAPKQVAATVVLYGAIDANIDQVRSLQAPVMGLFARQDDEITPERVDGYEQLMKKSLISYRAYSFSAGHGFADPLYPGYNAELAKEAWQQVDSFLATFVEQG